MSQIEIIAQLDRLILRLEKCHRLLHSKDEISDEEITALTIIRDRMKEGNQ